MIETVAAYENKTPDKKEFIKFLTNLGLDVNMHTKARGHQGIFRNNRIDISKRVENDRKIAVLAHEFAHYIHSKIEPDMSKTHGHLEVLFQTNEINIIEKELLELTLHVDKNASMEIFKIRKKELIAEIKMKENQIKQFYPKFTQTNEFKEFNKYIRNSKAKYFLRYDKVKFITPFLRREEIYCLENIRKDFPTMSEPFVLYLQMTSLKRKRAAISRRMNKYKKYYAQPTELFARFIESFFIDKTLAANVAPATTERFFNLLNQNYYFELKNLFHLYNF